MPRYLRFVRGVIDSADLPLNVSRELLQGSRVVDRIRSSAVKRVLQLLTDMAEKEPEKYAAFWKEFGAVLKEGMVEDFGNRDEIARLLRFTSTSSAADEADVSLADYVGADEGGPGARSTTCWRRAWPRPQQPAPGGVPGQGRRGAAARRGVVDNWVVTSLREFDGKRLQSVAQGSADLGGLADEAEKAAPRSRPAPSSPGWSARLKEILGGQAFDVRVTSRLTTSPACIVANEAESTSTWSGGCAAPGCPASRCSRSTRSTPWCGGSTASPTTRAWPTGRTCCSTRRCSPSAPGSTIPPPSSPG